MNNNSDKSFDRNQYMPPQPATPAAAPTEAPQAAPQPVPPGSGESTSTVQNAEAFNKKKGIPGPLIAGAILLLFIIGVIAYTLSRGQESATATQTQPQPTSAAAEQRVIPTIDASKPALSFVSANNATSYKVGDTITFQILANSQGADVNGYDLLFPYDKSGYEIVETKTVLDSFQIFSHDRGDYYAVTGLKLLSVTTPTAFDNTPILEMTLTAKKAGTYYFEIIPTRGKESSKFVDKDIKVIQPQIQPIKLEIR